MKKVYLPVVLTALLTLGPLSCFIGASKPTISPINILHNGSNLPANEDCEHSRVLHIERINPSLTKPGHIEFYFCCDCFKSFYDKECTQEIPNSNLGLDNKLDGRYLSPITSLLYSLPKNVRNYLNAKNDQETILALRDKSSNNNQKSFVTAWENNNHAPYTIEVSTTRQFTEFNSYTTNKNFYAFGGTFIPGETYYYRVKDSTNTYLLDDLSFKVDDSQPLRLLNVDGVSNMRDLGGWAAKNGIKVPYGKVYRGGELAAITTKGKELFLDDLGIKTEVDLRRDDGRRVIDDSRLNFQNIGIWDYQRIIPDFTIYDDDNGNPLDSDPASLPAIKQIFELLANPNNYPFYFHCHAGADRTGTICYLISGLLGVSYEDMTKDFELTTFSMYGDRYRSDVDEDTMTFTARGRFHNLVARWGLMNRVMLQKYGDGSGRVYQAIEVYLKTECGISQATIDAVRLNMLDQVVDFTD